MPGVFRPDSRPAPGGGGALLLTEVSSGPPTVALAGTASSTGCRGAGITLRLLTGQAAGTLPRSTGLTQKPLTGQAVACGTGRTPFPMVGRSPGAFARLQGLARPGPTGAAAGAIRSATALPTQRVSGSAPAAGRNAALGRLVVSGRSPAGGQGRAIAGRPLIGRIVALAGVTGPVRPGLRGAGSGQGQNRGLARPASSAMAAALGTGRGGAQRPVTGRAIGLGGVAGLGRIPVTGRSSASGQGQGLTRPGAAGRAAGLSSNRSGSSTPVQGRGTGAGLGRGTGQRSASGRAGGQATSSGLGRAGVRGTAPAVGRAGALGRPLATAVAPSRAASRGTPGAPALRGIVPATGRSTGTLTAGALVALVGRSAGAALARGFGRSVVVTTAGGRATGRGTPGSPALRGLAPGSARNSGTLTAGALVALVGRSTGAALGRGLARLQSTGRSPGQARGAGTGLPSLQARSVALGLGRGTGTRPLLGTTPTGATGRGLGSGSLLRSIVPSIGQARGILTSGVLTALVGRAGGSALVRAITDRGLRGRGSGRAASRTVSPPTPLQGTTGINSSHGTLTVGTPLSGQIITGSRATGRLRFLTVDLPRGVWRQMVRTATRSRTFAADLRDVILRARTLNPAVAAFQRIYTLHAAARRFTVRTDMETYIYEVPDAMRTGDTLDYDVDLTAWLAGATVAGANTSVSDPTRLALVGEPILATNVVKQFVTALGPGGTHTSLYFDVTDNHVPARVKRFELRIDII